MDNLKNKLDDIDGLLEENPRIVLIENGVGGFFNRLVNKYPEKLTSVKYLKALGTFLVIIDSIDEINVAIANDEINTLNDVIDWVKTNNQLLVFTNWGYEFRDSYGRRQDDQKIYADIRDDKKEVSVLLNDYEVYNNLLPTINEDSKLVGDINYLTDRNEVELYNLIHVYFEQYYSIIPW